MAYRLTRLADEDVEDIYVHGAAEFGIAAADKYHRDLARIFELLSANPSIARERSEFTPPVRIHPHGAHIVVYTIEREGILKSARRTAFRALENACGAPVPARN